MKRSDIYMKTLNSFSEDPLNEFISSLKLVPNGFGHQHDDPAACCGDRIIGDFELVYVLDGESCITVENREYQCRAGDVILIPPFVRNSIQTSSSRPHANYWLHFDVYPFYIHNEFISAILNSEGNKIYIGIVPELISLYQFLEKEINSDQPGCKTFFGTILTQIVTLLFRLRKSDSLSISCKKTDKNSNERAIIDRSMEFINENLSSTLKIPDLCNHLHISESYLFKSFMKVLKLPPNQFIQLVKIKQAEQLILTTCLSFKEISGMLGFSSQYYFSSVFKKYYHISPSKYIDSIIY